ncbi:MAG TPA: hypothetical protein VEO01_34835 [Pseudonocardiaceae bacterium]|nr:hypothetical protein [Pseudonocardiaceae bacterium]
MSDDSTGASAEDGYPQPASGAMDKATADWYVDHTQGQFQAFERDGKWYLHTPDSEDGPAEPVADAAESDAASVDTDR